MKRKFTTLIAITFFIIILCIGYLGFYEKEIEPIEQVLTIEVTPSK